MNNDLTNKPQKLGFQSINFADLEKFNVNLELDEIVLMQYLIFHCNTNRGTWFHSAADIGLGLKIKKHRFKTIIDSFEQKGWVTVKTGGPKNRRCFSIDFEKLCSVNFLREYYNYPEFAESDQNHVAEVFLDYLASQRSGYSKLLKWLNYNTASPEEIQALIQHGYNQLKAAGDLVGLPERAKERVMLEFPDKGALILQAMEVILADMKQAPSSHTVHLPSSVQLADYEHLLPAV